MCCNRIYIAQFLLLISLFKESLSDDVVRLPKHVVPKNYNLTIIPNYDSSPFLFKGTVTIQMICQIEGSKNITVHAKYINVTNYTLTDDKGKNVSIESMTEMKKENFLIFNLTKTLNRTSNYSLFIEYVNKESYDSIGFRHSTFHNRGKPVTYYYYTSMPLMLARTVFPCFDEPQFKATFDVTLGRKSNMTTLSNMPHTNINTTKSINKDLVFDEFQRTPNMSTHVVAFYISTFSNKTAANISSVDIKMWAPDYLLVDDNEILNKAGSIYNGLNDYLNTTQPIKKQDLVYVKNYERKGADSWGIINFASYEMYIGNKSLPYSNENNLFSLAHKLSHQWFGNLVTPSWWTYIWLNEGISTFMSYYVLQKEINKIWDKFSYDIFQNILPIDSSGSTFPLKIKVEDISSFLLHIISKKGACITRMMMNTFGEEVFKNGTQEYLKNFSFKNVDQDDLWRSIQMFVNNENISVKKIMSGWTNQTGYPLVTVNVSQKSKHILISQKQFLSYEEKNEGDTEKLWSIPLKYQVLNIDNDTVVGNRLKLIDENATTNISDSLIMNNTLVVANVEIMGFFRVNYDKNNWNNIIEFLRKNHTIIDVLNRAQFMDDAFSFVGPKIEEYTLGMNISTYLIKEKEELPWLTFFKHLKRFYRNIIRYNRTSMFMKYLKKITKDIFQSFKYSELEFESSGLTLNLMKEVASWACLSGNDACNTWAKEVFDKWRNGSEKSKIIVQDYLHTIVCSKLNGTDNETLNFVLEKIKLDNRLFSTIECVEDESQINLILNKSSNKLFLTLSSLSRSYHGRNVIRKVLRNITFQEQLLSKNRIYSALTDILIKSEDKVEFNKTELVFESIVTWTQFNTTIIEPRYQLPAIQAHIKKERVIWEELKGIEDEVNSVVINVK